MLMEDELHYDDDDENGEFEGIVNETDIINPSKDCDYDVDYNDMAARFESFLSRAQLASPASSPSTSEVKTSAESAEALKQQQQLLLAAASRDQGSLR